MNGREIRKFSRKELLELIIKQEKENEELRARLDACEQKLADRQIRIESAGTLAEAALALNGVFEAADEAARLYLENIKGQDT